MTIPKKLLISISSATAIMFVMSSPIFAEKTGTVTGSVVNFRQKPNLSATIMDQLTRDTKVKVIGSEDGWYQIIYNDITGWMFDDYVSVKDESIASGSVTGSVVNVRSKPDISSEVLTQFKRGTKVEIFELSGKWYRVVIGEEKYGWMHSDYISVRQETISRGGTEEKPDVSEADKSAEEPADKSVEATETEAVNDPEEATETEATNDAEEAIEAEDPTGNEAAVDAENAADTEADAEIDSDTEAAVDEEAELRQQIVDYAKTLIGIRYVYGGTTKNGFDCSGFVKYVYNHFDISIERVSSAQSKGGKAVKKADLKPGDLVFFDTIDDGKLNDISHVGIYIGDGHFIHASTYLKKSITIESMSSSYYIKRYMRARDYISD